MSINVRLFFSALILTLPWLNPFAPGPSPSVFPWLFTLGSFTAFLFIRMVRGHVLTLRLPAFWPYTADVFATSMLAAGLFSTLMALLQYFDLEVIFFPWINATERGDAFANLRQRNQFATLTSMAFVALMWFTAQQLQTSVATKARNSGWFLAAAGLLAVGNAISSSRTGLFQLVLICGLYAAWWTLHVLTTRRLLICAVLVYTIAMFALPWATGLDMATHGAFARLGNDQPCSSRLVLWSNVLHLIGQKPWLGWGWGELDYAHFITLYNEPRFCDILDNAHNLPLHLAVELGVPAALLVCGGFAWWVMRQKPWAERDADRQMAWAVMAVILLHSVLEYPLWYGPFQISFGLCLFILWCRPKRATSPVTGLDYASNTLIASSNPALTATKLIILTSFLVAIAYAAWDYHRVSQIYIQPEERHAAYQQDTLAHARKSWLFADQALFAELILTSLSPETAAWTYISASHLLHYSPEPRVVQKLIESAVILGKDAEALAYLARFKAAFPKEHASWAKAI